MPKPEIFFITPELQQVLDAVPEQSDPRSKLEPFRPYILRWRRQGKTYRKIAEILTKECKVSVSHIAVRKFVKRAARPRKAQPDIEIEPATVQLVTSSSEAVAPVARKPRMSIEERRAQADAMRANFKPLFAKEQNKPLFDYDPDKPLTLRSKEK